MRALPAAGSTRMPDSRRRRVRCSRTRPNGCISRRARSIACSVWHARSPISRAAAASRRHTSPRRSATARVEWRAQSRLRRRWRETNPPLGRHEAMHPPPESTRRLWPLRLMALVLLALGIVPMANIVAPGDGLQWWNQSVRLWSLWTFVVVSLALLIARVAPRVPDALPALFEWSVLRPSRRVFMVLLAIVVTLIGVFFSWRLFGLEPLTIDELSLQWQARLLASGRLY